MSNRDKIKMIRFTPEEEERIKRVAFSYGLDFSTFVRSEVLRVVKEEENESF